MTETGFRYFIALLLIFCCVCDLSAQVGALDSTFNRHMGIAGIVYTGVELGDSTVIVGGAFLSINRKPINCIAKLTPAGEVDPSFNVGTGFNSTVDKIMRQPDGKLLVAGLFTQYNGTTASRMARLNADGSKDTGFAPTFNNEVKAMLLQPDSMIVAVGVFSNANGAAINRITRLKHNGTRDSTFNVGTGANATIYAIDRQSDGKYIIAGDFTSYNGTAVNYIARLHPNGALDTTFNTGGTGPNASLRALTVLDNNKIMFSAPFVTIFNGETINRIARLMPNGARDTSFHSGVGINAGAYNFLQDSSGRMIVVGGFGSYNGISIAKIMRLDSLGRIDTSFHVGSGMSVTCYTIFRGTGNAFFLGGDFTIYNGYARFGIAKIKSNGDLDQGFMRDTRFNAQVSVAAYQSDGKMVVGGNFTRYSDRMVNYVARLHADGTLDTTFNTGGSGPSSAVGALAVRSDDKIYIGGGFSTYNGNMANDVALLDADGAHNTSFTTGSTGFGCCGLTEILPLPDGKLYVVGGFDRYRLQVGTSRMVRLKANGDRDSSFVSPIDNGFVYRIIPIEGKRLMVGGSFAQVRGVTHNSIAILDSTGKVDSTYRNGQGLDGYADRMVMERQPDGKLIIGFGNSRLIDGVVKTRIARLTKEGWLDSTYNANNQAIVTGGGSWPTYFKYLDNGTYVVGSFGSKFLDNNGAYDANNFVPTVMPNAAQIIKDDRNGRLILIGEFFTAFSVNTNRMIAFLNYVDSVIIDTPLCRGAVATVYFQKRRTFNNGNIFTVQLSDSLGSFASPVAIGTDTIDGWGLGSVQVTIPMYKGAGTSYRVRVVSTSPVFTGASSNPFTIGPIPPPVITAASIFCNGDSIQLSSSTADSYAWSTGDTTKNIWVNTSGTYTVSVRTNNCASTSAGKTVTEIIPDSLSVVLPYALLGRSDTCYIFSLDSFGISTDSIEWSFASSFDTVSVIATGDNIKLCVSTGTIDTIWFRPYVSGPGCRGSTSYIALRAMPYPIEVIRLSDIGIVQEVHVSDKLKFTVPGYTYAQLDSVDFHYKIVDKEGATITAATSVGYSLDGHYEISALSALSYGEKYKLDLILYNGNKYSFIVIRY